MVYHGWCTANSWEQNHKTSDQISFTQLHKKSWFLIMGGYTTQYIGDSPNSMYI